MSTAPKLTVVIDGQEYEIVWTPGRDAESLLPGDGRRSTLRRGCAPIADEDGAPFIDRVDKPNKHKS